MKATHPAVLAIFLFAALSFASSNVKKAAKVAAGVGVAYCSPYLLRFHQSDANMDYWFEGIMKNDPRAHFLVKNGLHPKFVTHGRYDDEKGMNLFLNALNHKNHEAAGLLLQAGADIHSTDNLGRGYAQFIGPDIESSVPFYGNGINYFGLDLNRRDENGILPLDRMLALNQYNQMIVMIRFGAKSDLDWPEFMLKCFERFYRRPEDYIREYKENVKRVCHADPDFARSFDATKIPHFVLEYIDPFYLILEQVLLTYPRKDVLDALRAKADPEKDSYLLKVLVRMEWPLPSMK